MTTEPPAMTLTSFDKIEGTTSHAESTIKPTASRAPLSVQSLSAEERTKVEKALVRKIDRHLLPMIVLMYIMNYLDRNNIAAAKLAGILTDLHLKGTEFQTSVSILFVGYLLMQVPSNLLLNKLGKPSIYLPACMVLWGLISGATAGTESFGGLIACRFFLGFVEAAYFPGCLYYLSVWYTRKELVKRTAFLYSGSLLSGAFSGLITAGITHGMDGAKGLRAWRWMFIIEGSITVVIAISAFFILPDFPRTTTWLTTEERELGAWRLDEDVGEDDWVGRKDQTFLHGAKLAAKDIKAWLLLGTVFGFTSAGTVTTFFPTVVKSLGYSDVNTLLLTTPPYLVGVVAILVNAWHADRTGERYLHIALPPIISTASFILACATTSFGPRYLAMLLMVGSNYSGYVVSLGWISNVLPRPPAKRAAALAGINALSNVCSIYSSYLYPTSASPRFVGAMSFNAVMSLMAIFFATILRFVLKRLNDQLDRGMVVDGVATVEDPKIDGDARKQDVEEHGLPGVAIDRGFRFLY